MEAVSDARCKQSARDQRSFDKPNGERCDTRDHLLSAHSYGAFWSIAGRSINPYDKYAQSKVACIASNKRTISLLIM